VAGNEIWVPGNEPLVMVVIHDSNYEVWVHITYITVVSSAYPGDPCSVVC